uniref:Protein involved in maintenance of golgi structure and er-golgi transport n=1 Tax=Panstrongylus megistus TaxID=65343 RepID=A0A069DV22_9HEMI
MATDLEVSVSQVDVQFDRLSIASEESSHRTSLEQETSKYDEDFIRKWGFTLKDLYKLALKFYKEKEGKAVSLSYQDKLKLVALTKQVTVGKFNPDNSPPLGVLDVIGRDRRIAWQSLGDLSTEDAMVDFIELIDDRCNLFRPYAQAHKADMENRKRLLEEEAAKKRAEEEEVRKKRLAEEKMICGRGEEETTAIAVANRLRQSIMEALNRQTYAQFRAYVEQHFPRDAHQQEILMSQLQEQHYQQYMEQVAARLDRIEQDLQEQFNNITHEHRLNGHIMDNEQNDITESDDEATCSMAITSASMWTRKDVKEFKESIRKEGGDAVIKVGHGETVTVRVPTNDEGTCLFWEFATDYYDIGFGVYFEWTKSATNQVSVHVSESEDEDDYPNEDDEDDEDDEYGVRVGDVEQGLAKIGGGLERAPLTEVLPVRRRDCMDQVYAGSHPYPGTGVYLLKFDNSYSLWRSKTLYYRVYYTR